MNNEEYPITTWGRQEQYKCPSYYYDYILKNCTCGKCDDSYKLPRMISDLIYSVTDGGQKIEPKRFLSYQEEPVLEYEEIIDYIEQKVINQKKELLEKIKSIVIKEDCGGDNEYGEQQFKEKVLELLTNK